MSSDFRDQNPFAAPAHAVFQPPTSINAVRGRVTAPAIALVVVGAVGLAASLFNIGWAFVEQGIDPTAPEMVRRFQQGAKGPVAAAVQTAFALVNVLIIFGGVQMMRFRSWGLALTAAILAMLNFGSCCCVAGLPVGIWSLVVLLMPEVKAAFEQATLATAPGYHRPFGP
jgi:hypothetical protein